MNKYNTTLKKGLIDRLGLTPTLLDDVDDWTLAVGCSVCTKDGGFRFITLKEIIDAIHDIEWDEWVNDHPVPTTACDAVKDAYWAEWNYNNPYSGDKA